MNRPISRNKRVATGALNQVMSGSATLMTATSNVRRINVKLDNVSSSAATAGASFYKGQPGSAAWRRGG